MTLIKSISGIRGTIGGQPGEGLTPLDVVRFTSAYATWLGSSRNVKKNMKVVVGRDARISGAMVSGLVANTLIGLGVDVYDLELSTTPTVEMAVKFLKADGGIILTASHNPKEWNALKLLNAKGEFISADAGADILRLAERDSFTYSAVDRLGKITKVNDMLDKHIASILKLKYVDVNAIKRANFSVVVDAINSSGAIAIPALLKKLGVKKVNVINEATTGNFAHNPEPLPAHLKTLSSTVKKNKAHLGISIDPDVDRLAFVCEDGSMFGEEYTLVAVADYVLRHHKKGNTVSNLSSTRALADVTQQHGGRYTASAVGEVNVVEAMKSSNAVIGGEGNGGIILPALHYGRDALVGVAIFLTHLAKTKMKMTALRDSYPAYHISKNKIELRPGLDVDAILKNVKNEYSQYPTNTVDGLRIDIGNSWVHLRKSNTEPIIRIYCESNEPRSAQRLAEEAMKRIQMIADNQ